MRNAYHFLYCWWLLPQRQDEILFMASPGAGQCHFGKAVFGLVSGTCGRRKSWTTQISLHISLLTQTPETRKRKNTYFIISLVSLISLVDRAATAQKKESSAFIELWFAFSFGWSVFSVGCLLCLLSPYTSYLSIIAAGGKGMMCVWSRKGFGRGPH